MSSSKKTRPKVEGLEGRLALTHVGASQAVVAVLAAQTHPIKLHGSVHGTVQRTLANPDVGATFALNGHGVLRSLGQVAATGSASGIGNMAMGRSEGSLTISNSKGSFTLLLSGPEQPSFSGLPSQYQYFISGGTGAYKAATGAGVVSVKVDSTALSGSLGSSTAPLTLMFHSK
jgi:hypothetical protein